MNVELKKIKKIYQEKSALPVTALQDISLSLHPGEFTALVGPSGSGKTTLFNILGAIDRPTKGRVLFEKDEISNLKETQRLMIRRKKIGYIFQFFNLIPTLNTFENAALPFWEASSQDQKRYEDNCHRLFQDLGITELKKRYPKELSGGQQQRVAIVRALVHFPQLVIADEPTGNLDSKTSEKTITLLKKECRDLQASFVVATHDMSLLPYFDRIITLKDGRIEHMVSNSEIKS